MDLKDLFFQSDKIEKSLGYTFRDKNLLNLAFVHCSFFNENRQFLKEHNERLEFLGDSVLGLIISDYLYAHLPTSAEGQLSHLRSSLVEANSCVKYLTKLDVGKYVLLGKGERMNDGRGRETILADLFEAIIGAIYLDGGIEAAKNFFFKHFQEDVEKILELPLRNWKAELQDYSQKKFQKPPVYKVISENGPDHSKTFGIAVYLNDKIVGEGFGTSKKIAERLAAEVALQQLLK